MKIGNFMAVAENTPQAESSPMLVRVDLGRTYTTDEIISAVSATSRQTGHQFKKRVLDGRRNCVSGEHKYCWDIHLLDGGYAVAQVYVENPPTRRLRTGESYGDVFIGRPGYEIPCWPKPPQDLTEQELKGIADVLLAELSNPRQ